MNFDQMPERPRAFRYPFALRLGLLVVVSAACCVIFTQAALDLTPVPTQRHTSCLT